MKFKKVIFSVIFAALFLTAFIAGSFMVKDFQSTSAAEDAKIELAVSYIYRDASYVVTAFPYTTINLTQTALMKVFSGEKSEALSYLNTRVDRSLQASYSLMDEICENFKNLLTAHSVSETSMYYTKYNELCDMFTALKTSSTELIKRTRAFINGSTSTKDSYYTSYAEQLSDLSDKIEAYGTQLDNEYNALMKPLLGDDYDIVA